jgi:hypothetical protein
VIWGVKRRVIALFFPKNHPQKTFSTHPKPATHPVVIFDFIVYNLIPGAAALAYLYYSYRTKFQSNRTAFNVDALIMGLALGLGMPGIFPMWTGLVLGIVLSFVIGINLEPSGKKDSSQEQNP